MPTRPNPENAFSSLLATYLDSSNYQAMAARTYNSFNRQWSGVKTPNWSNPKLRPKPKPYNDFQVKLSTRKEIPVRRYQFNFSNGSWNDYSDQMSVMLGYGPPDYSYALYQDWSTYQRALDAAMSQVKDMKVNILQTVAESKQLLKMFDSTVPRLAKAITLVKRGRMRDAARALGVADKRRPPRSTGHIASDWLALQYGWKPLLADVRGAAQLLAKRALGNNISVRVKKTASSDQTHDPFVYKNGQMKHVFSEEWYDCQATVVLEFSVDSAFCQRMSETGISDPALLAWELLPYSFVVDWFLPVGNYLENLMYDSGLSFKRGYYTMRASNLMIGELSGWESTSNNVQTTYFSGKTHHCENKWVIRGKYVTAPRPSFPSMENPFSATHVANALALLRVAFK